MRVRSGQEISGSLQPPPVIVPLQDYLKKHLKTLECPVCGEDSQHGAFFYIFLENADLCLGVQCVSSQELDVVTTAEHVFSANIKGIRCKKCGFNSNLDRFCKGISRGFLAKVDRIDDYWTRLKSKDKYFSLLTDNLKRNVRNGDVVEVLGISLDEIEDHAELIDTDIVVQKRGEE